ncbi:hypothetical protein [Carnobacterium divergens]|uniref:hypothetical protein n=1 Tax=Carnobacterium divergens TaxID=2748 RepID=UPI0039AF91A6
MNKKIRWRTIMEINYREGRKQGMYFNRKYHKKLIRIWDRARRLRLTEESFSDFSIRIIAAQQHGYNVPEMKMSVSQLEKHLVKISKGDM